MSRILVVDDEHNIRMMVRLALEHLGHAVGLASDGPEGLEKFGNGSGWDLVLLDQRMPGMEGLYVLEEIRMRDPKARIVMITAFGTIDLAVDTMKAGAKGFLRKPFTAEVLRGSVQAALDEAPAEQAAIATVGITFAWTTVNGFRIETQPGPGEKTGTGLRHVITIYSPTGASRRCSVLLPGYIIELAKAYADREEMPGGDRFWQALCEEVVANYLWQHAEFPPDEDLRVDNLTTGLKRWADSVLSVNK